MIINQHSYTLMLHVNWWKCNDELPEHYSQYNSIATECRKWVPQVGAASGRRKWCRVPQIRTILVFNKIKSIQVISTTNNFRIRFNVRYLNVYKTRFTQGKTNLIRFQKKMVTCSKLLLTFNWPSRKYNIDINGHKPLKNTKIERRCPLMYVINLWPFHSLTIFHM